MATILHPFEVSGNALPVGSIRSQLCSCSCDTLVPKVAGPHCAHVLLQMCFNRPRDLFQRREYGRVKWK